MLEARTSMSPGRSLFLRHVYPSILGFEVSAIGSKGRFIRLKSLSGLVIMKVTTSWKPKPTKKFLSPLLKTSNGSSPASVAISGISGTNLS